MLGLSKEWSRRVYALSSEWWFDLFVLPGDSASSRSS
jgi:hypothetical protein